MICRLGKEGKGLLPKCHGGVFGRIMTLSGYLIGELAVSGRSFEDPPTMKV